MENKTKILFVCNNLHIGGIQKSLINLLGEISDIYAVTLFLFADSGELKKDIPENVKILCGNRFTKILGMSQEEAKKSSIFAFIWRSLWAFATKFLGISFSFGILTRMQKLKGEYDVAISFSQNSAYKMFYGGCNEFVINAVSAKKKISFVHCDFLHYYGNNAYNRDYYKHFDAIACVSESCKRVFDSVCPQYSGKTFAVHNCYNFDEMRMQAIAYTPEYSDGSINIFTCARISEEKGIFRMFPIFRELKNQGIDFDWRIAGSGPLLERAIKECRECGLEENIKFLGMIDNPYPYFKSSDLLLVPSYDEAAPMVFGEAAFFGLPVFTTNTTSANELVRDAGIGFVCENTDCDIKKDLSELLKNPQLISDKAKEITISNQQALDEFKKIIDRKDLV